MGVGGVLGGLLALRFEPRRALLTGTGLILGNTVWESTLQRHIPGQTLSRVSAYDWIGAIAFKPIGLALWGPVAVLIGTSAALWLAAALLLASCTIALVALPEVRRFP